MEVSLVHEQLAAAIDLWEAGEHAGHRTIQSEGDCRELAEAIVLAVAIAIDPLAGTHEPDPEATQEPVVLEASELSPSAHEGNQTEPAGSVSLETSMSPPPPSAPPSESPSAQGELGVVAMGIVGSGATVTAGATLFGAFRYAWMSADLAARIELPTYVDLEGDQEVELYLVSFWLAMCGRIDIVEIDDSAARFYMHHGFFSIPDNHPPTRLFRLDGSQYHRLIPGCYPCS